MRVRAAAVALVLGLVALAAPAASGEGGSTAVQSSACVWKVKKVRVVKRVRRGDRWVKVVKIRRRRVCVPVPTPPPSTPRLSVRAHEFSYVLSRPEVPAGEVILEFNNMGEDPHDLNLAVAGSDQPFFQIPETDSRGRVTQRVTIPAAGQYVMWCGLPEHRERGMEADLVVGAPPAARR